MITRKQYISGEFTHEEYYAQFVDDALLDLVRRRIGVKRIKNSTDKHLNDIPLAAWDVLYDGVRCICGGLIARANGGGISLSDTVCAAKAAAWVIKGES